MVVKAVARAVVVPVFVILVFLSMANNWLGARDLYFSLADRIAGEVAEDFQDSFTPTPAPTPSRP